MWCGAKQVCSVLGDINNTILQGVRKKVAFIKKMAHFEGRLVFESKKVN